MSPVAPPRCWSRVGGEDHVGTRRRGCQKGSAPAETSRAPAARGLISGPAEGPPRTMNSARPYSRRNCPSSSWAKKPRLAHSPGLRSSRAVHGHEVCLRKSSSKLETLLGPPWPRAFVRNIRIVSENPHSRPARTSANPASIRPRPTSQRLPQHFRSFQLRTGHANAPRSRPGRSP